MRFILLVEERMQKIPRAVAVIRMSNPSGFDREMLMINKIVKTDMEMYL